MPWVLFLEGSESLPGLRVIKIVDMRKARLGRLHEPRLPQFLRRQFEGEKENNSHKANEIFSHEFENLKIVSYYSAENHQGAKGAINREQGCEGQYNQLLFCRGEGWPLPCRWKRCFRIRKCTSYPTGRCAGTAHCRRRR
jgi:hypothetical protein